MGDALDLTDQLLAKVVVAAIGGANFGLSMMNGSVLGAVACRVVSGVVNVAINAGIAAITGQSFTGADAGEAFLDGFMMGACFTGEMLIDVPGGKKLAEDMEEGDLVAARDEFDPSAPVEYKEVEEVFTRVAPIWNVHVAGQILRTTAEHPFWVELRGWIPAAMLEIGDVLLTRDGRQVPVEGVADSGEVKTVYNWRIGDYHTYFVSATEEGASLWAHNQKCTGKQAGKAATKSAAKKAAGGAGAVKKGKAGVKKTIAKAKAAGETVKGTEVTFELPSKTRTRADVVTKTKGNRTKIRESKNGPTAKMSRGQTEMQNAVRDKLPVIPRGRRASMAGFTPGKPVTIGAFELDAW